MMLKKVLFIIRIKILFKIFVNFLDDRKISYKIYRQTFEFGQPLKDDEEVIKYLNKWYGEKGINLISNVKDIDYNYNGEIFTKYYCKPKNTAIVVVEKEEI